MKRNFAIFYDLVDHYGQMRGSAMINASIAPGRKYDMGVITEWLEQIEKANTSGLRPAIRAIAELDPDQ